MKQFKKSLLLLMGVALFAGCKQEVGVTIMPPFPIEKSIEYYAYDVHDIFDPAILAVSNKYLFLSGMNSDPFFPLSSKTLFSGIDFG